MYKAAFGPLFYYAKKGGLTTSDKLNSITALANDALSQSTDGYTEWASLLGTISRLYKYPFYDQLMIHAQRPGATACASYEVWNDTMRRYVRRGAKGIALVDNSGDAPRLRYVFDIADTGTRRSSRPFSPWQIDTGNIEAVSSALEDSFGAERGVSLASQLEAAAALLVDEYWMGNSRDILDIVDGSSLEEYDDFNILIDIQAKLSEGKGAGYERWAKVFNLKQMAQTINFLKENGDMDFDELSRRAEAASEKCSALTEKLKATEARMSEVEELKKQVINYLRTRETFRAYKASGYSKRYLAEHEQEILLHRAAKKHFNDLGLKKLPTVKALQAEYAALLAEKRDAYPAYREARTEMKKLLTYRANAETILGGKECIANTPSKYGHR